MHKLCQDCSLASNSQWYNCTYYCQDEERNHAYRLAIDAVVQEDDLVVDIGTGYVYQRHNRCKTTLIAAIVSWRYTACLTQALPPNLTLGPPLASGMLQLWSAGDVRGAGRCAAIEGDPTLERAARRGTVPNHPTRRPIPTPRPPPAPPRHPPSSSRPPLWRRRREGPKGGRGGGSASTWTCRIRRWGRSTSGRSCCGWCGRRDRRW